MVINAVFNTVKSDSKRVYWAHLKRSGMLIRKFKLNKGDQSGCGFQLKWNISLFTITAEIHARSLANFYSQYADRHMNLKSMRRVSEREPAIW